MKLAKCAAARQSPAVFRAGFAAVLILTSCRTTDTSEQPRVFNCSLYSDSDRETAPSVSLCGLGPQPSRVFGKMLVFGDFKNSELDGAGYPSLESSSALVRRYADYFASPKVVSRQPKYFKVVPKDLENKKRAVYFKWYAKPFKLSITGMAVGVAAPDKKDTTRMAICIISPIIHYSDLDDVWSHQSTCEDQTKTLMEGGWSAYLEKYASSENHVMRDLPIPPLD